MSQTVFIVDDEPQVRTALRRLLHSAGYNAVACESPDAFLAQHTPEQGGCLLLDVSMPGISGLELQQRLLQSGKSMPVVFLTGHGDVPMSVHAMKLGAVDFLCKPVEQEKLLRAVRDALEQDAREAGERSQIAHMRELLSTLTPREREVLPYVISGRLNKQIAYELGTVEKTVKVHRARLMKKLEVTSVAELVRFAEKLQIGPTPMQA